MNATENYEIIHHGINNSQYWQGCGTSFTDFEHCVTGIGDNPKEALDDALDQIEVDLGIVNEESEKPSCYEEAFIQVNNNLRDFLDDDDEYNEILEDDDEYEKKVIDIIEDKEIGLDSHYYISIRY